MKILVNVLSGIGDALMFTPALVKLKEICPDSQIDALVMYKGVKDIYENLPEVSQIHYWDFLNKSKINSLIFVLRLRNKYDVTINAYPSNRREYNLISLLSGSKQRAAVEYLRMDYQNFGFLNNIRVKEDDTLHNVEENVRLVEKLTGEKIANIPPLKFNIPDSAVQNADVYFEANKIDKDKTVIGFHPGCSTLKNHDKRRWEPGKFSKLGEKLIENHDALILVFGGPEEKSLKEKIISGINSKNILSVDTNSLSETAAIMKRCDHFVTNDSSLMHVAAALQLNTTAIIGPTNTNYIHPWQTEYQIASLNLECSPCFYYSPKPLSCSREDVKFKCIKELSADFVYEMVSKKLSKR